MQLPIDVMTPIAMYKYDDAGVTNDSVASAVEGGTVTGVATLKNEAASGAISGATVLRALHNSHMTEEAPKNPAPFAAVSTPTLMLKNVPTTARPMTSRK